MIKYDTIQERIICFENSEKIPLRKFIKCPSLSEKRIYDKSVI